MRENLLTKRKNALSRYWVVMVLLLSSVSLLQAQDILLGQYDFTTGTEQEKPAMVTSGLTFSDVIIEPEGLTAEYIDNTLVTSGWPASLEDHPGGKMVQFTITKGDFLSEYNVSKIMLYYKATADKHRIDTYYGTEINPTTLTCKRTGQTAVDIKINEMDEGRNSNGVLYDAILNDMPTYYAIAFQQPTEEDEVTFDRIEVWGTATAAPSAVSVDVLSKSLNASYGNPIEFSVNVTGYAATQDVAVSLVGDDAGLFSVDKTTLTTADLNTAVQTVNVTYNASEHTYDLGLNAQVPHEIVLRMESAEIPTIDIPVYGLCHVLYEDFAGYDDVVPTTAEGETPVLTDFPVIPGNEINSAVPGWSGDYLYGYVTGKTYGSVNIASSAVDSAYLITPAVDLSEPFNVTVTFRSFDKGTDGRFYIYMDDQLMHEDVNSSNSIVTIITPTFIGSETSKIKFTGVKNDFNQIIVDDIIINYSSETPVNGTGLLDIHEGSIKTHADGVELTGFGGKHVQVYALTGVKVTERTHLADQEFISVSHKGAYVLRIYDTTNQVSRKIIIQ